jgi:hypothetical protein|tara:strand:+ start:182 stop:496 length:315 start_codon:yes stop_codon:yes gene_type:complete
MNRDLINKSNEVLQLDSLEREDQEIIQEISIGKLSTTMFIGRLKVLSRKIKDITLRKSIMTLGYLIYTVSLQSKSLKKIEDSLKDITQQLKNQNKDIEKLKTNK